ncbi:ubiquitin-like-conjugating enzyme ATG10 [Styela clava]
MDKLTESGRISLQEFLNGCSKICCSSGWVLQHKDGYDPYMKNIFHKVMSGNNDKQDDQMSEFDNGLRDIDNNKLQNICDEYLTYECHVIFSHSYSTPVLYFIVHNSNGKMLTLQEVWSECGNYNFNEKWDFITQVEHPTLLMPYYQLHPCHTAEFMKPLQDMQSYSDKQKHFSNFNYVHAWLSIILPVIGLSLV